MKCAICQKKIWLWQVIEMIGSVSYHSWCLREMEVHDTSNLGEVVGKFSKET